MKVRYATKHLLFFVVGDESNWEFVVGLTRVGLTREECIERFDFTDDELDRAEASPGTYIECSRDLPPGVRTKSLAIADLTHQRDELLAAGEGSVMGNIEKHFERFDKIKGYNTSKHGNGDYVDREAILLRQGFAWGMDATIEEATRCIRELGDSHPVKPSEERSRTLVRVVEVGEKGSWARVCVPGWNVRKSVLLHRDQVPPDIWALFEVDKRLHARVNVGADEDCPKDLVFSDWEHE